MSPTTTDAPDSPTRRRTRRAIIDAAVRLWAQDFSVPLGAVADEAGVSRSTLHRYFEDRQALVEACVRTALEVLDFDDPDPYDESAATPVLDQLAVGMEHAVALGHWVLFCWSDPHRFADLPDVGIPWAVGEDDPTLPLVRQGQAGGELDPEQPAVWLLEVYYGLVFTAAERVVAGTSSVPEAARLGVATMRRALAPPA